MFETTGGLECEAEGVLKSLLSESAKAQGKPVADILNRLKIRISIDLQRALHRALQRRRDQMHAQESNSSGAAAKTLLQVDLERIPMED